jgi:hypothetical protein
MLMNQPSEIAMSKAINVFDVTELVSIRMVSVDLPPCNRDAVLGFRACVKIRCQVVSTSVFVPESKLFSREI